MSVDPGKRITVSLQNGRDRYADMEIYEPGDSISGRVRLSAESPVKGQSIVVSLMWQTEGRGKRDKAAIEEQTFSAPQVLPGMPQEIRFHFRAPDWPYTYSGQLINIVWMVQAKIDLRLRRDPKDEQRFIIRPRGLER